MQTLRIEGWALAFAWLLGVAAVGCTNASTMPIGAGGGAGSGALAASGASTAGAGSSIAGSASSIAGSHSSSGGSGASVAGASAAGSRASSGGAGASTAGSRSGAGGTGASAAGSGSSAGAASFRQVYAIFSTNCAGGGCHISSFGAAGLAMPDQNTAYMNLVGVPSTKCRSNQRVVAGNPDASVLYHALTHTSFDTCRAPSMPQGRPMLSQADLGTVQAWIMAGATNQ